VDYHEQGRVDCKVALDNWNLFKRFAQLLAPFADVSYSAQDSGGTYNEDELSTFREKVAARDGLPDAVHVRAYSPFTDLVAAHAWWWAEGGAEWVVWGTSEEAVRYLNARIPELFRDAGEPMRPLPTDDDEASTEPPASPRPSRLILAHPFWIGTVIVGVLFVVGLLAAR
jgi:hypothetical protein